MPNFIADGTLSEAMKSSRLILKYLDAKACEPEKADQYRYSDAGAARCASTEGSHSR